MTIKEEIQEELRNRTPFAEIRDKYRSQSQLYEALREHLDDADKLVEEADRKVEEADRKAEKAKRKVKDAKARLHEVKTKVETGNRGIERTSKRVDKLKKKENRLSREVAGKTKELANLEADITELQARGFTSETIKEIKTIPDRTGPELLSQVRTAEQCRKIGGDVSRLKKSKTTLEHRVQALKTKEKTIDERITSERNRLDELKLRTVTFKEGVAVVSALYRDGYSTEDIQSLKHGLDVVGVKGDPALSISRLVRGVAKFGSLTVLEEKVDEKENEYANLKKAVAKTGGELKVERQLTQAFRDVKEAGVKDIEDAGKRSSEVMDQKAAQFDARLDESFGKLDSHIKATMEGFRSELGEWSELQQKKGELKELLYPGQVFLGIMTQAEYLKTIPLPVVAQLAERLHRWCEMNLPDVSIRPSQSIHNREFNLQTWNKYKLIVLVEFVVEGLKHFMIQQTKHE